MILFFKEIAWWNMWKANIANAKAATDLNERKAFCKAAAKNMVQVECFAALYWASK